MSTKNTSKQSCLQLLSKCGKERNSSECWWETVPWPRCSDQETKVNRFTDGTTTGIGVVDVAGSTAWNSLSDDLCDPTLGTDSFRRLLKTRLFSEYYCIQRIRRIALYALYKFTTCLPAIYDDGDLPTSAYRSTSPPLSNCASYLSRHIKLRRDSVRTLRSATNRSPVQH